MSLKKEEGKRNLSKRKSPGTVSRVTDSRWPEGPKGTVKWTESPCSLIAPAEFHISIVKLSRLWYVWGQDLQAIMPFFAFHKLLRMNV